MEGARQYLHSRQPKTKAGRFTASSSSSRGKGKPAAKPSAKKPTPVDNDSDYDMPGLQDISDSGESGVDMPALSNSDDEMPKLEPVSDSDDENDSEESLPGLQEATDSEEDDSDDLSSDDGPIPDMVEVIESQSEAFTDDSDDGMPNLSLSSDGEAQARDRELKIVLSPPRTYLETTEKPPVWRPVLTAKEDAFIQAAQDQANVSAENLAQRLLDSQTQITILRTGLKTIERAQSQASTKAGDIRRRIEKLRHQKKKPNAFRREMSAEESKATDIANEIRKYQSQHDSMKSRLEQTISECQHIESLQRLSESMKDEAGLVCLELFEKVVAYGGEKGVKLAVLSKGLLYSTGWITTIQAPQSRVFLRGPNGHYPFDIALDLIEGGEPASYPIDILQKKCADVHIPPPVIKEIRRKLEHYYRARIQQGGMHWEEFVDLMAAKGFQEGQPQGDQVNFGPPVPTRRRPNVLLPKPRCVMHLTQQMLLELDILLLKNWGWTYADAEATLAKDKRKPPFGHRRDGWGTLVVPFQDALRHQEKLEDWIVDTAIRRVKVVGYGDDQAVRSVGAWSAAMRQNYSVDVWQEDEDE
ncbi:hypothetical protein CYLTODRAFT_420591 [Cylindrobasidium torrendii FP15055 ss-10]|uniref:Uncharacterized protein n=1 Tax=Cylindrobasidium torrendii FP15055 ss-10 TaxID=1314674 RepID=A0A0D7BIQ7_9AGAR|nr:hypothetical protein CYLTODRAFT_420591 [Cylindrobasidium torrendii FP15055 ss-10]